MRSRNASHSSLSARTRRLLAGFLLAAAIGAPPPRAQAPAPTPGPASEPRRNIGGPGDYALREKIVRYIMRDEDLSKEPFTVILVNGGAVFSGEIKNCALKKRALSIAGTMRGVINVTDEMTVPRGEVPDAELARAVTSALSDAAAPLELKDLDVQVTEGVLTLTGAVKNVNARAQAEDIAGTVLGVTRISNHLLTSDAPSGKDDASILKAVVDYLRDSQAFGFPGDISVDVKEGVVTLRGRTNMYLGRQRAAVAASLVKGVVRVDNRIKADPSLPPRASRIQAEK